MAKKTAKTTKKAATKESAKTVSGKKRAAGRSGSGDGAPSATRPTRAKSAAAAKKETTGGKKAPAKSKAEKKSAAESSSRKTGAGRKRGASKPQTPVTAEKAEPPDHQDYFEPVETRPIRKSHLKPEELNMFQDLLLAKRNQLLGTVKQLRDDALHKNRQDASGDLSSMPIHMADIGSDNWEQEFTLDLLANENDLLREIDQALERIDKGTYGTCLGTNKPIQKRRLRARPWAKYRIEYARELELRGRS